MSYKYRIRLENEIIKADKVRREIATLKQQVKQKQEQMKHEYAVELKTWLYKDILQQIMTPEDMCNRIRQRTQSLIKHEYITVVNGETNVTEKGVKKIIEQIISLNKTRA